jgi:trigger factor
MTVEILDIGPCKKKIKVHVSKERVSQELAKSYREVSRSLSLKGFRRGHVPIKLIEKRFGESIEHDLRKSLVHETLHECIEENNLDVIGEPAIEGEPSFDASRDPAMSYEATIQVRPDFDLPDLNGLRVVRPTVAASDADVAESLDASRRMRAKTEARAEGGAVEIGDLVIADVDYLVDGEVARSVGESTVWTDEPRFGAVPLPELGQRLAGAKVSDVIEVPATFPAELGLRGGAHALRFKIGAIHQATLPAIDDDFAKEAGFENLAELKDEVRRQIIRRREQRADAAVDEAVIDELLKRVDFPVPDDIVDKELDDLALRAILSAQYRGAPEEEAKAEGGKVRAASRDEVVRRLKALFLLDKLAAREKIFATEGELDQAIASMAARRGRSADDTRAELEKTGMMARLRYEVRIDKARAHLRDRVEVIDAENR